MGVSENYDPFTCVACFGAFVFAEQVAPTLEKRSVLSVGVLPGQSPLTAGIYLTWLLTPFLSLARETAKIPS